MEQVKKIRRQPVGGLILQPEAFHIGERLSRVLPAHDGHKGNGKVIRFLTETVVGYTRNEAVAGCIMPGCRKTIRIRGTLK